ncbi:hypothetical protein N7540_007881 [Penicillium herquei]|nr:hypothetical protein N7540_007881 [Penicillium herquei]
MTDSESVRLHITPFNSDLLPSVLPPSIRATATEISFHTISTFPENNYGYVTLPKMDAEKIKKKLNGSILKGKKFKIEAARPQKRQLEEEVSAEPIKEKKKSKKTKSEKPNENTIEGYELPSDRKVKRGWTDPSNGKKEKRKYDKSKKKDDKKEKPQPKSKYSEKAECLFLTKIPPNRASVPDADDKKAKKKKASDNVVHEFAKTYTQPSFLRSTDENTPLTATFDEEKGWMDNTGNVKEDVSKKARKKDYLPGKIPGAKEKRPVKTSSKSKSKSKAKVEEPESSAESEDWTSSSGSDESSDSESESESESEDEKEEEEENDDKDNDNASDGSSSSDSDSSDEEEETDEQKSSPEEVKSTDVPMTTDEPEPEASESNSPAENTPQESSKEVHPLEALFKRPATETNAEKPTAEPDTGFSFFGNGDDIESDDEPKVSEPQTPFTPFTKRDIQDRGLRSAAPTPDTGIPGRHMKWNEMEDDEDEMSVDTPVSKAREAGADKDETEFSKWFWENRGDNNRAWKKRRRDVAKEQRQRENRKKGMKGKS